MSKDIQHADSQFAVSDDIIAAADRCQKNVACLDPEQRSICPVEQRVMDVLFVEPDNTFFCPYKTSFGESYVCGCPVRQELYAKHRI